MNSDPFIGTWELDPDTLDYQFGRPGRRATYASKPYPAAFYSVWMQRMPTRIQSK